MAIGRDFPLGSLLVTAAIAVCIAAIPSLVDLDAYTLREVGRNPFEEGTGAANCPLCTEPPLCASPRRSLLARVRCAIQRFPLSPRGDRYGRYVRHRLYSLGPQMVKGSYAVDAVVKSVERKLRHRSEPMVLHFAGDNGVGKTRLAQVVSLAMGMRCGNDECTLGDSTLELSGTSYDGLSTSEFRQAIVPVIAKHATLFPDNGVVVLNDLSALSPDKVRVLLPLFGRGDAFPEFRAVPMSRLLVLITTDFGREGRTRGKSLQEMQQLINEEFSALYTHWSTSYVYSFPFLPISLDTAQEIARMAVGELSCATPSLRCPSTSSGYFVPRVHLSDDAVLWLVERVKALLSVENGRAVVQEVRNSVEPLLVDAVEANDTGESEHTTAVASLTSRKQCDMFYRVDVGEDGGLVLLPADVPRCSSSGYTPPPAL